VPSVAVVELTTQNLLTPPLFRDIEYSVGTEVRLSNVYLRPGEGAVFRWKPGATDSKCSGAASATS